MSIKRYVRFTCCCDGPCGQTLEVEDALVPAGWVTLELHDPNTKLISNRATYCPGCARRLERLASEHGFTVPTFEKRQEVAA
jgi:hypothetical protein